MSKAQGFAAFSATFEFATSEQEEGTASSTSLKAYVADGPEAAVRDAVRFWNGRREAMPEHFHQLYAIKVWFYWVGGIDAKGNSQSMTMGELFEWKYDFPGSLEDWFEYKFRRRLGI